MTTKSISKFWTSVYPVRMAHRRIDFFSDQSVDINIRYGAYRSLGRVHVSVFIFRSDGVTSCMIRTKLDEYELVVGRGEGTVTVQLKPLQLVGGTYYVEAEFLDETDSMMITSRAVRSDWFMVKGKALSHNESSVFEPNTSWTHTVDSSNLKADNP